jgi:hypothetical protein
MSELDIFLDNTVSTCLFLISFSLCVSTSMKNDWMRGKLHNFEIICGVVALIVSLIIFLK